MNRTSYEITFDGDTVEVDFSNGKQRLYDMETGEVLGREGGKLSPEESRVCSLAWQMQLEGVGHV